MERNLHSGGDGADQFVHNIALARGAFIDLVGQGDIEKRPERVQGQQNSEPANRLLVDIFHSAGAVSIKADIRLVVAGFQYLRLGTARKHATYRAAQVESHLDHRLVLGGEVVCLFVVSPRFLDHKVNIWVDRMALCGNMANFV